MGQEIIIPEGFGAPAQAFIDAGLNSEADNLAEGIGQSYGVINYKGRNWSLRYRGQRYQIVRPDDGTPSAFLDVIILDAAAAKSKSYYTKWDPNQSEGERPLCSSIDGITPDPDSKEPQCTACAICPRNEWKMQTNGKNGRECQDYKRLAVLLMPNVTERIMGQKLLEPVFLRVPPASLNSLAILGETMRKRGYHSSTYVTRITFDPDKSWPEMVFRPLQGLSAQEAPAIIELRQNPLVGRIVHGDRRTSGGPALTQAPQPLGLSAPSPSAASAPRTTPAAGPVLEMQASSPGNTFVLPATGATQPVSPLSSTPGLGFIGATDAIPPSGPSQQNGSAQTPQPTSPASPSSQSQTDVGVTEESDAALDAKIAEILAKKNASS